MQPGWSGAGVEGKTAVGYAGDSPRQQVFVFNSSFSGFYVSGLNFRAGFKMSYNNQLPDGINCIFFYNVFNLWWVYWDVILNKVSDAQRSVDVRSPGCVAQEEQGKELHLYREHVGEQALGDTGEHQESWCEHTTNCKPRYH